MKTKLAIYSALVTVALLSACKKKSDDASPITGNAKTEGCLIISQKHASFYNADHRYTYNNANQIKDIKTYSEKGNVTDVVTFNYLSDKFTTEGKDSSGIVEAEYSFILNDQGLAVKSIGRNLNDFDTSTYTYNTDGYLIKTVRSASFQNSQYKTYVQSTNTYTWVDGNKIKSVNVSVSKSIYNNHVATDTRTYTEEYTYGDVDNKNNFEWGYFGKESKKLAVTKKTTSEFTGGASSSVNNYSLTYTLNAKGLITQSVTTNNLGSKSIDDYTYQCD